MYLYSNKALFDKLDNEIIVIDELFNIIYTNKKFEKTTGYIKEELLSKNLFETVFRHWNAKYEVMGAISDINKESCTEI